MSSENCQLIITQKDLDKFINKTPIIKQLLFRKFVTLKSIYQVFPCQKPCKTKIWKKNTWLNSVLRELSSSVVLKGIGKGWLRNEVLTNIYDTYCSGVSCEYTGFFICANTTLVNMDPTINNHPLGLIIVRNARPEDGFNIKCQGQTVPASEISYGEIISVNPDLQELGIGKLLIGVVVLYFRYIHKKVAVLSIAHGFSNRPAYHLYSGFGFVEEEIHIGPEEYGSTLASLVAYPFRRANQHYSIVSMPKMIWCMDETTLFKTKTTLERELGKTTYRETDVTRRLPNPKTTYFTTLLGELYWKLIYRHLKKRRDPQVQDYQLPEYLYTDEYYQEKERQQLARVERRRRLAETAKLGKAVAAANKQRVLLEN